eukprot:scaffold5610_cov157-Amphora_coffeaeformis.AAC.5
MSSETGNRTPVSRVTGGDTSHYTISDFVLFLCGPICQPTTIAFFTPCTIPYHALQLCMYVLPCRISNEESVSNRLDMFFIFSHPDKHPFRMNQSIANNYYSTGTLPYY